MHLNEFGKSEHITLFSRRKTRIILSNDKFRVVPKGYRINNVAYRGFDGWIDVYNKNFEQLETIDDWKAVPKYPNHHKYWVEYARRRELWLENKMTYTEMNNFDEFLVNCPIELSR